MASAERQLIHRKNGVMLLFTPPFDRRRSIPATSRAIRPAFGRMAGNIPMPPLVDPRLCELGEGDKAADLFAMLNPINHANPRRHAALQGRALCRDRRYLLGAAACRARRLDLVHRLGRLDVSRRPRADAGIPGAGQVPGPRSLHPPGLAALRDHLPPWHLALRDRRRQSPWGQPGGGESGDGRQGVAARAGPDPPGG